MTSGRKLIFFGNERLISGLSSTDAPVLTALIEAGYDIKAIVANDSGTKSRKPKPLEVAEIAQARGIPIHLPTKPMDIYDLIADYEADAAILVAYGRIVPQKLIDLFPFGIINIHPSLLPLYRGPSPIESAIVNGDSITGVSIMSLTAKMDAGPVYHQIPVYLAGNETAPHLAANLASLAASELVATLPKIFDGSLQPLLQDEARATYCNLITKSDARLDPDMQTAQQAERLVRAYTAFPKARIQVGGYDLIITDASLSKHQKTPLDVAFKDGEYLSINQLIAPSGKTMSADAFITGYLKD